MTGQYSTEAAPTDRFCENSKTLTQANIQQPY